MDRTAYVPVEHDDGYYTQGGPFFVGKFRYYRNESRMIQGKLYVSDERYYTSIASEITTKSTNAVKLLAQFTAINCPFPKLCRSIGEYMFGIWHITNFCISSPGKSTYFSGHIIDGHDEHKSVKLVFKSISI